MSSLIRSSSRKKFNLTPQDLASCLDQKNSMIAVLQAQVQELRFNAEKYERLQQDVYRSKEKYENLIREYQISKFSNQQRLDLTAKNCIQLKVQLEHLDKQIHLKNQQLKESKAELQQLVQHSNRKQDDAIQIQIRGEQLRASNQLLKMQGDRTVAQITLAKEQNQRQRRQNSNVNKSLQTVKEKCYKIQSYIRNLLREQTSLNESLAKTQDQNNYLDRKINQMNSIHTVASTQCANTQKEIQDGKFLIASKELQLKRLIKQIKEAAKNLGSQKQKMKILNEQHEQKKFSLNRLQNEVRQCSEQINFIISKNSEVTAVNNQLQEDLKVCGRHLQNVIRVNKSIDIELKSYRQTNLAAIRKLQQPFRENSNLLSSIDMNKASGIKWNKTSRLAATGMGLENSL